MRTPRNATFDRYASTFQPHPWRKTWGPSTPAIKMGLLKTLYTLERLPRVAEAMPQLRNPMVSRTLTELRKVVNAIVATFGRPVQIRIELARDMKKGREARAEISKRNRARGKVRDAAKIRLIQEAGIAQPKARDVEKLLLAEECGWECPYTGRGFGMGDLMGQGSPIDIEHIIPFSRSLDDSFVNKTLCWADENRNAKHNKLPMEAYGSDRMAEILGRVSNFKGDLRAEKLRRFRQESVELDFTSSQLNDTAYASKLAGRYLSPLYGGLWDDQGLRILNCKGQMTATLRREWKLDQLLGGGEKYRGDHRHHAVDALVVALTDSGTLQMLSRASRDAHLYDRKRFAEVALPWADLHEDSANALAELIVSHRVSRKINGRIHKETNYGFDELRGGTQRIAVGGLTAKQVESILDPGVRARVKARLIDLKESEPGKAFKEPKNHPYFVAKDGREIPIHKVTISVGKPDLQIADGHRTRFADSAGNHHVAIFETNDGKGGKQWVGSTVTQYEAMRRHHKNEDVVNKETGFLFSLYTNMDAD